MTLDAEVALPPSQEGAFARVGLPTSPRPTAAAPKAPPLAPALAVVGPPSSQQQSQGAVLLASLHRGSTHTGSSEGGGSSAGGAHDKGHTSRQGAPPGGAPHSSAPHLDPLDALEAALRGAGAQEVQGEEVGGELHEHMDFS